jgi:hypothetical protein
MTHAHQTVLVHARDPIHAGGKIHAMALSQFIEIIAMVVPINSIL